MSFLPSDSHSAGAGATRFESGLAELRASLVVMAGMIASGASVILLVPAAHRSIDLTLQAVMLALSFGRTARSADFFDRSIGVVLLPIIAAAVAAAHALAYRNPIVDDAFLVLVVCASIWIRRFGPRASAIGTSAVLPVVAMLVVRTAASSPGDAYALWMGVAALGAALWVFVLQWAARSIGFIGDPRSSKPVAEEGQAVQGSDSPATARMLPNTRMALQMGAALLASGVIGRAMFPTHGEWSMITAFIVCSGARGRGDVVYKAALRLAGAVIGTAAGTWLAWVFGPRNAWAIVAIFGILTMATWLRSRSYAYWAGGFTAALALLYGLQGETSPALLVIRVEAIMIGALLGVAASSFLFPIRSSDIARRRIATALAALAELIGAKERDQDVLDRRLEKFEHAAEQLDQIYAPLDAHRRLLRYLRSRPHIADAVDAMRQCREPASAIVRQTAAGDAVTEAELVRLKAAAFANINAVRRALGRRPGMSYQPLPDLLVRGTGAGVDMEQAAHWVETSRAIRDIDAAIAKLARVFAPDNQA